MTKEKRNDAAGRAVDAAKGFFGPVCDEPLVTTDCVLLREVIHALQILWGYSEHELNFVTDDDSANEEVLLGLLNGSLVARVYLGEGSPLIWPIIPRVAWPRLSASSDEEERESALSSFWISSIRYEQDCKGHVDHLPVVLRDEATGWLNSRARDGVKKIGRPKKSHKAAEIYWEIYPDGHHREDLNWARAHHAVDCRLKATTGETICLRALQDAIQSRKN